MKFVSVARCNASKRAILIPVTRKPARKINATTSFFLTVIWRLKLQYVCGSAISAFLDRAGEVLDLHLRCRQEGDSDVEDDIDDGRCVEKYLAVRVNANSTVLCLPPVKPVVEGLASGQRCYNARDPIAS